MVDMHKDIPFQSKKKAADLSSLTATVSGHTLKLIEKENYVTYEMFGAKGDGTDDSVAIQNAHTYANSNNLPIKAKGKAYNLGNANNIIVQTDVDWNGATFQVNETVNSASPSFLVTSKLAAQTINVSTITTPITPTTYKINELSNLGKVLLVLTNSNVSTYYRLGYGTSEALKDFCVLNYGNVETPFVRSFAQITSAIAYPIDEKTITLKNANFITSTISTSDAVTNVRKGIRIQRSNVVVDNVNHNTASYILSSQSSGFYVIENADAVKFRNSTVVPRNTASGGTYEIQMNTCTNLEFNNIKSLDVNDSFWGVIGANYLKNVSIYNSNLNRFDCHKFLYGNTIIKDTAIGTKGLTLEGGGNLTLENIKSRSLYVLELRADFGASWNGNITCKNIEHTPTDDLTTARLFYVNHASNQDFGFDSYFGSEFVKVDGYKLNTKQASKRFPILDITYADTATPDHPTTNNIYKLAKEFTFKNFTATGTDNGFCVFNFNDITKLTAQSTFTYSEEVVNAIDNKMIKILPNIIVNLDNIAFNDNQFTSGSLFGSISTSGFASIADSYTTVNTRIIPKFNIVNCNKLRAHVGALPAIVNIKDSEVYGMYGNSSGVRSIYKVNNSEIIPTGKASINGGYCFRTNRCATFFNNCNFYKPVIDGIEITGSTNAAALKLAYNFFADMDLGDTSFYIYNNFNNCMFSSISAESLVNNGTVTYSLGNIGDNRYNKAYSPTV